MYCADFNFLGSSTSDRQHAETKTNSSAPGETYSVMLAQINTLTDMHTVIHKAGFGLQIPVVFLCCL